VTGIAFAERSNFQEMKRVEEAEKLKSKEKIVKPKAKYNAKGLRDPFKAPFENKYVLSAQAIGPDAAGGVLSSLKLQGVIWGGKFPQAIINGKVVKIGDTIDRVLVVDITKDGVLLFLDGKQYNLSSPASVIDTHKQSGGAK
jgi:hypothetical protein